jgi:hypothetical protein
MAYLYIHNPWIFPIGFFEECQLTGALISRKIRSRGSVAKRCLFPTDTVVDDLIRKHAISERISR